MLRILAGHPTRHNFRDYQVHIRRSCAAQTGSTGVLGTCNMARILRRLRRGFIINLGLQGSIRGNRFTATSSILIRVVMHTPYRSLNNHPAPVFTS
jgi:hypothetical protein